MPLTPIVRRLTCGVVLAVILGLSTTAGAMVTAPRQAPLSAGRVTTDTQGGPEFHSGSVVTVSKDVDGDVYAAGQSVTVSGHVTGDVIAAAQTITITGSVDGDVRLAGQDVIISGDIGKSGTIYAQDLTVTEAGSFGDDVVGALSTATIAGVIGRNAQLDVGRLSITGSVGGDMSYTSDTKATIDRGAVGGLVHRSARSTPSEVSPWAVFLGWLLGLLYALIAFSLITLLAGLVIPLWLQRVTDHLVPSPWKALLVGFVASVAVPAALLFLLITVIGAPLAIVGVLVWTVLTLASFVYGAYYVGRLLFRSVRRPVAMSLVGGAILIVALHIPWLNVAVWFAVVFFGAGAQLLEFHSRRAWRSPATALDAKLPDSPRVLVNDAVS